MPTHNVTNIPALSVNYYTSVRSACSFCNISILIHHNTIVTDQWIHMIYGCIWMDGLSEQITILNYFKIMLCGKMVA